MTTCVTELGYLGLGVSDIESWKAFATEVIGLEVVGGASKSSCTLRSDYWNHRIILTENRADDIDFAGWRVADQDEFDSIRLRLEKAGVRHEMASRSQTEDRQVLALMTLKDPGGMPIEIFYGPHIERSTPFYPGRRMHGGFVTGDGGLGHIAVNTPYVDECDSFYRKILGMKGSIEFERELPASAGGKRMSMRFMSCNSRQHSLAFGDLGGEKRLSHLMLEVAKLEDVGLTRDIVKRRQIPIFLDIGQHHNDRVVSFYFETPSGWHWECGWGVVEPIGQAEWGEAPIWGHEHMPQV